MTTPNDRRRERLIEIAASAGAVEPERMALFIFLPEDFPGGKEALDIRIRELKTAYPWQFRRRRADAKTDMNSLLRRMTSKGRDRVVPIRQDMNA